MLLCTLASYRESRGTACERVCARRKRAIKCRRTQGTSGSGAAGAGKGNPAPLGAVQRGIDCAEPRTELFGVTTLGVTFGDLAPRMREIERNGCILFLKAHGLGGFAPFLNGDPSVHEAWQAWHTRLRWTLPPLCATTQKNSRD